LPPNRHLTHLPEPPIYPFAPQNSRKLKSLCILCIRCFLCGLSLSSPRECYMIALYRNGQAGCFWRKTLTELNESGGKKRTNIYVGSGIVAEQLVHQADDTHSTEWEDVLYKHEDIVTGSYQKTTADGTLAGGMDPPARVEFEPLGGAIPDGDPYIADEGFDPRPLRDFSFAGDVNSPEFGCTWDGMPFSCGLLSVVLHGQGSFRLDVNTRMSGGWEAYNGLSGMVSTWRYDIRQAVNYEDSSLTAAQYKTPGILKDYKFLPPGQTALLVGTVYAQYLSPFAEMVVGSLLPQMRETPPSIRGSKKFEKKLDRAKERFKNDDCQTFLSQLSEHASLTQIKDALDSHPAFSAQLTTGILMRESGIFDDATIDNILTAPDSQVNNLKRAELGITVAEYFRIHSNNAMTNMSPRFPGVYYNDSTYDSQTILHETLHYITGLSDVKLAAALNLRDDSGSPITDPALASLAIKNGIYENCR